MKNIFSVLVLLLWASTSWAQNLVILHTNDTHSHIEPQRSGIYAGQGGVIERAVFVDSVRNARGEGSVLLVDAGDFSQGSSYFTELGGNIEVEVMNAMRYDVACLGNHEFDNGIEELVRRVENMNFPVVCSNYEFPDSRLGEVVKPYAVLYRGGLKIGFIGLLTDVSRVVEKDIADKIVYKDPAESARYYAEYLKKKRSCDMVICLSHLGLEKEPYTDGVLVPQIEYVDMVIGGHSHTFIDEPVYIADRTGREIPVVTDGCWGLEVGMAEITVPDMAVNHMIAGKYDAMGADSFFTVGGDWFPYPAYTDRAAWAELFGEEASKIIALAEKELDYEWKLIPASAYLAYERTGERTVMENPFNSNRRNLNLFMLAELAEGQGRFLDKIMDGLWMSSQMTSWVLSAHNPRQSSGRSLPDPREQIIDLGSGGYGALVAVAYHFFHEAIREIDPSVNYCVEKAVKEKILDPYFDLNVRTANWWMAEGSPNGGIVNNWNPWCNSNVILCFLLMEKDPERLAAALRLSAESVDRFIAFVKHDGACEEGPAYWPHAAGKLYDYLQIMHDASGGRFSFFDNETVRLMGEYISRSYIGKGRVVNFADASAVLHPDFSLVYRYGAALGSDEMKNFALSLLLDYPENRSLISIGNDAYRSLESIRCRSALSAGRAEVFAEAASKGKKETVLELRADVPANTWYPETEFCYFRNEDNWFFAAKGGFNNESHNHNDAGTFILYADDVPVFVDAGVGTYTKKTFSYERYTIWSMQSDWHNLPMINGASQIFGSEFKATDVACDTAALTFSAEISTAYGENARCDSWVRSYSLEGESLRIMDSFRLKKRAFPDVVNFLVSGEVYLPGESYAAVAGSDARSGAGVTSGAVSVAGSDAVSASGVSCADAVSDVRTVETGTVVILSEGRAFVLNYPAALTPSVETMPLDDPRLSNVWGPSLRRISFTSKKNAPKRGSYDFLLNVR